ncbi:unnamed protein product [Pedinophyceae sp. YPF-701]|nr:unnamed protein product [Pedinophyceae sp. YPF-701]
MAGSGERATAPKLRVAFLHPDLGLGGAERLIVDMAQALVDRGHEVVIYTSFHDPERCFPETVSGAFDVKVRGAWFPRALAGRGLAACAYARALLAAFALVREAGSSPYDVVVVDQVSAAVPLLRAGSPSRVVFYCHFPDLLLARPASALHRLYRAPLDRIEESTTAQAHLVLVNSIFTRSVFHRTFKRASAAGVDPEVLYPCVDVREHSAPCTDADLQQLPPELLDARQRMFLSINRFERKKGLPLAIKALAELQKLHGKQPVLVFAGGYDTRVSENVEHLEELRALAADAGVEEGKQVFFVPSFTSAQRRALLALCAAVVYTPADEHFGIVPLEAMASSRPVIACNSGGPLETVVDGSTGLLVEPDASAFASAMQTLMDETRAAAMGAAGRKHVAEKFGRESFGAALEAHLRGSLAQAGGGAARGADGRGGRAHDKSD